MSDKKDKIFAEGLWVNGASEKARQYGVKANIMIRVKDFKNFLDKHNVNDKVYLTIRENKAGELYTELDQYRQDNEANRDEEDAPAPKSEKSPLDKEMDQEEDLPEINIDEEGEEIDPDDIPF